jgi:type II secretory pathway predicted ATPase ExeA
VYLEHFGLTQPPFKITPNTAFFFPGGNRGSILDALVYAITQGEGIVKVTGEVGSGKTMLCRMLEDNMPETVETVYLANPSVEPGEILHAIAFELHIDLPHDTPRLQVMQALQDYLLKRHQEGKQVVLFVEEAQAMPLATLEEIRLLSNLETQHHKLLQIVLFGQPELDEHLADPAIRQLRERVVHSFHLDPLNSADIRAYLNFRMRQAGYKGPDAFAPPAVREIARASLGLTRRINIIADKALLVAYTERTHNVTAKHVLAAAKDSDFIDFAFPERRAPWRRGALLAGAGLGLLGIVVGFAVGQRWSIPERGPAPPTSAVSAALPASAPPIAPVAAPVFENLSDARLEATQKWLEASSPDTVSIHIQLMGAVDAKKLDEYLEELSKLVEIEKVFVYRTKAGGKPAWSVLYGSFPGRAAALEALSQLPVAIKAQRPYLRTVQGVRAETESAR